jgi:PhzF family phenazine biosynthesis protein
MKIAIYQVDAFTRAVFGGNPAAVCPLESWLDESTMQRIAAENNLSETAFLVRCADGFEIRWFTPTAEVVLCGHGTLASGLVALRHLVPAQSSVRFFSKSGELSVARDGDDGRLRMRLPRYPVRPTTAPPGLEHALGATPREVHASKGKLLCIFDTAEAVAALTPDFTALARLEDCVAVTAPGGAFGCDFVSRYFAPNHGIPEDPVTGSAHCALVPFWAGRLGRPSMYAKQISKRGGELWCTLGDADVTFSGYAVQFLRGEIEI